MGHGQDPWLIEEVYQITYHPRRYRYAQSKEDNGSSEEVYRKPRDSDEVARRNALSYCFGVLFRRHVHPVLWTDIDRQPFRLVQDHGISLCNYLGVWAEGSICSRKARTTLFKTFSVWFSQKGLLIEQEAYALRYSAYFIAVPLKAFSLQSIYLQRGRPFPQYTRPRHVAQEEQHSHDIEQSAHQPPRRPRRQIPHHSQHERKVE